MQIMNKLKAFSFAEIMLVLVIMGVVATMTVPVLKKRTDRTEYATRFKKAYLNLETAVDAARLEEDVERWDMSKLFDKYMLPKLIVARDCGKTMEPCFPVEVKEMTVDASHAVALVDGIGIANKGTTFYIDINAAEPPNIAGVDVFELNFENTAPSGGTKKETPAWKFVPKGYAKQIMDAGWVIKYW